MTTYKMLKTIFLIQSDEILPTTSTMMKELGWEGTYEQLSYDDKIDLKKTYVLNHNSLKKFLDNRGLLEDGVRNQDVVIYLTSAIPTGSGIYFIYLLCLFSNNRARLHDFFFQISESFAQGVFVIFPKCKIFPAGNSKVALLKTP